MTITIIAGAKAALDAAYRYLASISEVHEHDCACNLCQACGHAADAGTLLGRIVVQGCQRCGEQESHSSGLCEECGVQS